MRRRLAALVAIVAATGGGIAVTQQLGPASAAAVGATGRTQVSLPATGLAAVPVCPGPQTLVVPAGGQAVNPGGPVVVGAVVEGSSSSPASGARLAGMALATPAGSFGLLTLARTAAGLVPLQASRAAAAPAMSAVQLGLTRSGDLRGLSALSCTTASSQTWLVGGGTQIGRREQLVLANPAATAAEVDVTVHGPDGPVRSATGSGVVVPAQRQIALRVDALAPGLDAVAVHVVARSGRVSASLHDSWLRGVTPSGVDDVTAAAPVAARQVVPGIVVAPPSGTKLPSSATAPGAVAVRVVNPGTVDLVARVRLLGGSGEIVLPDPVVTVGAGAVRDVPVTDVPAGLYTAVVEGDGPLLAGAVVGRTVSGGEQAGTASADGASVPPSEFGWAASVEPLTGVTLLALPWLTEPSTGTSSGTGSGRTDLGAVLSVAAAAGAGGVEVTVLDAKGQEIDHATLLLTAGAGAQKALSAKAIGIRLRPVAGSGPVSAAVALQMADAAGPLVAVLPVRSGPTGSGARPHVVADPRVGLRP